MFLTFAKKLGQAAPPPDFNRSGTMDPRLGGSLNSSLGKSQNLKGISKGLGMTPNKGHSRKQSAANALDSSMDQSEAPPEIIKCDLAHIDNLFGKFYKTEESLSGFLNVKNIKQKFADFRLKLDVWKKRSKNRNRTKRNYKKYTEKLLEAFKKAKIDFTYDH